MEAIPSDSPVTEITENTKPQKKYIFPYWSNKENRHLMVTIEHENGKKSVASIQDKDGTNPDMKTILEQFTEEQIDENTRVSLERRNENLKKTAERRESQKARKQQESLFTAKLQAFEIDAVKNCKDIVLKRNIRKAKSIMEVTAHTVILIMKEIESAEKDN